MTEKEPKGFGQGQQAQGSEPTQKEKASRGTRDAPRQVGPRAPGQASPMQEQERGSAQTQQPGAKGRDLTTREMQDQRPRALDQKGVQDQKQRAQDKIQDQRARGQEQRERATTKEQTPRGQVREGSQQQKQPTAQQRQDRTTGEATTRSRTQEQTGRAETQGRDIQLSSRQETTIQQTFQRERNVNIIRDRDISFSISIGATVPRSVRLAPLPASIVAVVPQFRGYRYVIVEEEIVIVHPRTYAIVTVLPYQGAARASVRTGTRVQLSGPQRQRILSYARAECETVLVEPDFRVAVGAQIPQQIELCPFEDVIVQDLDVVRPYRFVVVRNQVVLVDPSDYRIVEVIR